MFAVTVKAGLLFVVVMALLGTTQAEPVTDMIVAFLANGVIPGTNFIMPSEVILVAAAMALMMVTAALCRSYAGYQARMRALIPNYDDRRHDPPYSALVPGLGRLQSAARTAQLRAIGMSQGLSFWVKYAARPVGAQAVTMRNTVNILMRTDRWAPVHIRIRLLRWRTVVNSLTTGTAVFRSLRLRVQAYLLRVTML